MRAFLLAQDKLVGTNMDARTIHVPASAGAHLGWPGIGCVVRKGEAYRDEPAA